MGMPPMGANNGQGLSLLGILKGIEELSRDQNKGGVDARDRTWVTHVIGGDTRHYTTITSSYVES